MTPTLTTPTFITEALHLVAGMQLFKRMKVTVYKAIVYSY